MYTIYDVWQNGVGRVGILHVEISMIALQFLYTQVVATFLIQEENSTAIAEALRLLCQWCPAWNPKAFMTVFCPAESKAIRSVFPGILTIDYIVTSLHYLLYLCDHIV